MPRATVTSKGQITLPKDIRMHLGVGAGDRVEFRITADGTVTVTPQSGSARRLFGFLGRQDLNGIPVEAMDSAVAETLADDLERTRGEL
jgi:AbrB family looped-hinge helix DNA binding protein